jgi:serine/threonine protein kinase
MKNPDLSNPKNPTHLSIKIIDFGTAIRVEKHKKIPTSLIGTLFYMAPEFIKGFFTEKCDIWSSGIILFYLLFKELPFVGKN